MARQFTLLLALAIAAAGCAPAPGTSRPVATASRKPSAAGPIANASAPPGGAPTGPSAAPVGAGAARLPAGLLTRTVAQTDQASQLTGKVKLISDHGAAVISNNGGTLLANNGGSLISDHGGAVISDNSGGLVSKSKYRVTQTDQAPESTLVDATVYVQDAAGRALVDAQGKPLAAVSDGQGGYKLQATLPAENLVLKVRLWNGGELSAILPKAEAKQREVAIDTAATLGASYVLSQFVKGDQATFDKLPASEVERLRRDLEAVRGLIGRTPDYQAEGLVKLTDELRAKAPAVDKTLTDIKALLLGQANLGGGRQATDVPLADPRAALRLADGSLLIAEGAVGRIRRVAPDGTITTWLDSIQGEQAKANWYGLYDLRLGPDGAVYGVDAGTARVRKLAPDGTATVVAGSGDALRGPLGARATESNLNVWGIDVAADGTLYVAENQQAGLAPRVLAVAPDGAIRALPEGPAAWLDRGIVSVAVAADGTLWALTHHPAGLWRLAPGATSWVEVATGFEVGKDGHMRLGPDGLPLVSENYVGRVVRVSLDGQKTVLAGKGGPPGTAGLVEPCGLFVEPGGRLLIVDLGAGAVWALGADQTLTRVAGQAKGSQAGADGAIAVNTPGGLGFDSRGRMVVSDGGSHTLRRFDGKALETIAGDALGFAGDGGPATAARFDAPAGIAVHGDTIWVIDSGNSRLRKIAPDGTITTAAGHDGPVRPLEAGVPIAPEAYTLARGMALAIGPDGLPTWTDVFVNQVHRLRADGRVELVAGTGTAGFAGDGGPPTAASLDTPLGLAYGPDGALYISDGANMRIRRITPDGKTIETFAGQDKVQTMMGLGGDPASAGGSTRQTASLVLPGGLFVDPAGNLYVGEMGTISLPLLAGVTKGFDDLPLEALPKVAARIRKFAPDGAVSTLAGPGGKFFSDPSAADGLLLPSGLALDPAGRLVIMDAGANLIRFLPAGSY